MPKPKRDPESAAKAKARRLAWLYGRKLPSGRRNAVMGERRGLDRTRERG